MYYHIKCCSTSSQIMKHHSKRTCPTCAQYEDFFSRNMSNPPKQNLRKMEKKIVLGLKCNATSNYMMFYMPARATLQRQVMKNYAAYLYNISMYSWDLTQIWNTQFDVVLVRKHWRKQLSEWPDVYFSRKAIRTLTIRGTAMLHEHWEQYLEKENLSAWKHMEPHL